MQYDVKSANAAASATLVAYRTRVKGMLVIPLGAGSVVLNDGGSGGTARITISNLAAGAPFNVLIPGEGVLFYTDVYATLTNAAVTVFYG